MTPITASMLYDYVSCPHRVSMDLFADLAKRDRVSPFVQLLWDRGVAHEKAVMADLRIPFVDLSGVYGVEKQVRTLEAMDRGESLIYSGQIGADDLLGIPDLLRRDGNGYMAGDIKSGAGEEGATDGEDGRPKKSYAMQLSLYTDVLERIGRSAGRRAFVWDIHRQEVIYDLQALQGQRNPQSFWSQYENCVNDIQRIIAGHTNSLPAYASGVCKNCVWYSSCVDTLKKTDDLTLIPEFGRSKRDVMIDRIPTIHALAEIDPTGFLTDRGHKTVFPSIGPDSLRKFHDRARLIAQQGKPYLKATITLPAASNELFFDIEVDPMRDICYLHGFIERTERDNESEKFVPFFADEPTPQGEMRAFAEAVNFMQSHQSSAVYFYSKYERTIYRKLRAKYPSICTEADLEALFDRSRAIDLYYDVVLKSVEFPTRDYSIKTLAKYLGFEWRDPHPSGAESIQWFDEWVQTRDPAIRQRVLEYNEDDCRATRVLLDGIRALS